MRKTSAWFVLAALLCSREALACAPAPHPGERIAVVEESAVIIWEPSTKTQHFIRRATFQGQASDFGFLVPTPTAPTLASVDDGIFDQMKRRTTRQTVNVTVKKTDFTPLLLLTMRGRHKGETAAVTAAPPVEVLSIQKVAGYEAAVLDATDAGALTNWLATNGYATTPDLTEWLDAYVAQRWILTAFKIDKTQDAPAQTSAVKMSFTTDRPFFPYREPASQGELSMGSRTLRVWFLGPDRVRGVLGTDASWPGQMYWSEEHEGKRLTAFEDTSSVRPGTDDLFFITDPDQRPVVPPPYEITNYDTTHVPIDVLIAPLLVVGVFVRRRMRQGRPSTAPRDGSPDRRSDG